MVGTDMKVSIGFLIVLALKYLVKSIFDNMFINFSSIFIFLWDGT